VQRAEPTRRPVARIRAARRAYRYVMVQRSAITLVALAMLTPFAPLTSGAARAQPAPPELPLDGHALSVAGAYGCARTRDGHAACWGSTPDGEHSVPATVPVLADLAGIATATGRVVAWSRTGEVWQWTGEPATRVPLTEVVEIAASEDATCARRRDGGVACWLAGAAPASAFTGATQIAVAGHHACARAGDDVSCWTISADPAKPAIVARAHGAIAIAGADRGTRGSVIAVVLPRGKLVAWAYAWALSSSSVGAGAITALPVPALPADVTAVTVGDLDMCALGASVTCWADDAKPIVRPIGALAGARAISIGNTLGCAALSDRSVRCWGSPGDIGDGKPPRVTVPVDVAGLDDAVQLGAAGESTCVRRANGHVVCWGSRLTDDWGARSRAVDLVPREIPGLADATDLWVGRQACAHRKNGHVACWGFDGRTTHARATDQPALTSATWLGVLAGTVCGLRGNQIRCGAIELTRFHRLPAHTTELWSGGWYRGEYLCARAGATIACQERWVAHGEETVGPTTFDDADLTDVVALHLPIQQETEWLCVARRSGEVACKSMVNGGFLPIDGVDHVRAFSEGPGRSAGGGAATCAVTATGAVACWDLGQDAGAPSVWTIPGITDAVEVAGGSLHACVRRKTGKVACWGVADFLGNGDRPTRDTPGSVRGVVL
jgi:hypothetical protein